MSTVSSCEILCETMKDSYAAREYCDFTISCEGRNIPTHRFMLCLQSDYFSALFKSPWKESNDYTLELKEDSAPVIEAMIQFMYSAQYTTPYKKGPLPSAESDFLFDAEVYAVADKYSMKALKKHAQTRFQLSMESTFKTYAPWFRNTMQEFSRSVVAIYSATPSSKEADLRAVVTEVSHRHISDFLECPDFVRVLEETPDFGADLVRDLVLHERNRERVSVYRCPSCFSFFKAEILDNSAHYCLLCGHRDSHWWDFVVHQGIDMKALIVERKLNRLEKWIEGGK